MKRISIIALLLIFFSAAFAESPKREMRAGWLATVYGIDWPKSKVTETGNQTQINNQKQRLIMLLDRMKMANINTVFFQVRGRADAMYKSSYDVWAVELSDSRGFDPGYDPLTYVIEEAHKRGMELHAWVNPYRFESQAGAYKDKPGDYRKDHPEWVLELPTSNGPVTILDPGNPEVQGLVKNIIGEIVNKYDVDGIVFDDYFYVETITNQDTSSQNRWKPKDMPVGDWRRSNVNTLIENVQDTIKKIKPYVQFGVSPRGFWTTSQSVADSYGVDLPKTRQNGSDTYNAIYCDALAWMKAKTIDYISPQIYWATDSDFSYTVLCEWWSRMANLYDTQFYASHYLSEYIPPSTKISLAKSKEFGTVNNLSQLETYAYLLNQSLEENQLKSLTIPSEDFIKQIENNRTFDKNGAPGSVFFSCTPFIDMSLTNFLRNRAFQNKAIRPALWRPAPEEGVPTNIRIDGSTLKWDYSTDNIRYVVYAVPNEDVSKAGNFALSKNIVDISYEKSLAIPTDKPTSSYTYAVSVLDRYGNEYAPVLMGRSVGTGNKTNLQYPENGSRATAPFSFKWETVTNAEYYVFEISEDAAFFNVVYKREMIANELSSVNMSFLKEQTYYWRVKTVTASSTVETSDTWSVNVEYVRITDPTDGSEISLTPTIRWSEPSVVANYYTIQIAKNTTFDDRSIIVSEQVNTTQYTVPEKILLYNSEYYMRVKVNTNEGEIVSDYIKVNTETKVPETPVITEPANNSIIRSKSVTVKWVESPFANGGFRVELSKKSTFPTRETDSKMPAAYVYETTFDNLSIGDYYIRMRASYGNNLYTAYTDAIKITIGEGNSIESQNAEKLSYFISSVNNNNYLVINSSEEMQASASIYNLSGAKVFNIFNTISISGENNVYLLPDNLPKGIYIIKLVTKDETKSLKWIR
ncbi:MAG: family 10 glycosylhydrolase [Dysgonomonas sp.]